MNKPFFRLWALVLRSLALIAGFVSAFHLPLFAQQKSDEKPDAAAAEQHGQPPASSEPVKETVKEVLAAVDTNTVQAAADASKAQEAAVQAVQAASEIQPPAQPTVVIGPASAQEVKAAVAAQMSAAQETAAAAEAVPAQISAAESSPVPKAAAPETVITTAQKAQAVEAVVPEALEPAAAVQAEAETLEQILPGDMEIPTLGPKPGSVFDRTGLDIVGVGLTSSHKPFINQQPKETVESKNEFPAGTSQIFWFAFFQPGRTNEERMRRPKFTVEWFEPGGQKVYYGTFRANIAYPDHVKTRLPLNTLGMGDVSGRWRVRVMSGDQLVDERHFMIAKPEAV